jgi:trans-aconitate methyltransferase
VKAHEKKALVNLYESRYVKLGYDIKTVGWGSLDSQLLRFKILGEIGELSGASVCDIGCGFGDFYPYLIKSFGAVNYTGVDIVDKLIEEAACQYPEAQFTVCDILETPLNQTFDYTFCSGALNYQIEDNEAYIEKMLEKMFSFSTRGIAVNFLSSYVDFESDKNYHLPPEVAFKMAQKLSRHVTIRHDYPLYEYTLYVYR